MIRQINEDTRENEPVYAHSFRLSHVYAACATERTVA